MEFDNLITSPFGFGEKLILELLQRGESVFALFPSPKDVPMSFLGKKNIKYGFLRLEQDPVLQKALPRRIRNVFHVFEQYKGSHASVFKANTLATLLILEWAKSAGVEKMIYMSSGEVYGAGEALHEESRCEPHGFYATTKYQAEVLVHFYERFFEVSVVRVFFPFGPGLEQGYIYEIAKAIKHGDAVNGKYARITPTFVGDAVAPLIKVRTQQEPGVFNICGSAIKAEELSDEIARIIQKSYNKAGRGKFTLIGDNARAKAKLDYSETALNQALQISFDHFK